MKYTSKGADKTANKKPQAYDSDNTPMGNISPIVERMMKGDPLCKITLGSRVEKVFSEKGDVHPVGSKGYIVGSLKDPKMGELYLIVFDQQIEEAKADGKMDDVVSTLMSGAKIKEIPDDGKYKDLYS